MNLILSSLLALLMFVPAQAQHRPDTTPQKAAMQKLSPLVGQWKGNATVMRAAGDPLPLKQTEEVAYKLDGLVLVIEGTGRDGAGTVAFNALGVVSYDQASHTYKIRAWNAGNFVETELKVNGSKFEWSFQHGPVRVQNTITIDEKGVWTETSEAFMDGKMVHNTRMVLQRL
ncbi:MAG TPA: hypothetical protein VEH27_20145 [Methylomirabilota bacterium]|nr:hypothetical protein [Methylomirabilota bacterium]